jgi:anti-sigma B factor antagonist
MEITKRDEDGVAIVQPSGRIDTNSAKLFGEKLADIVRGSDRLVIDFQQTSYISSAGFRSLLIARKMVGEKQGKLVLCGMSAEIRRVFAIGAFTELFVICATSADGIAAAR